MLAAGSDEELKSLAEKDVAGAASTKEQVKLGDAWWDVSKERATYWYKQALPGLAGLEKDRVEKRVAAIAGNDASVLSSQVQPLSAHLLPGLVGEYFSGHNFERRLAFHIDPIVSLAWASNNPRIPSDHFSVKWTGVIIAPKKARYVLTIISDDGHRLWIDGKLIMDCWKSGANSRSVSAVLLGDKPHAICVGYYQHSGPKSIVFKWRQDGSSQDQDVPPEALFHARGPLDREAK